MQQLVLPISPPPEPTLANFVPGANAAVVSHLQGLSLPPAPPVRPLYLWGPMGSGKTHLLKGLVARCGSDHAVAWFDSTVAVPTEVQPQWQLVVLDNCQQLSAEQQHAAFALFNDAASHGVQFAAAGSMPPVDLPLRDDLRTRLAWGHVFAVEPLSELQTRTALRQEATRRGLALSDDVLDYLLARFTRDLQHQMHLLAALDSFGLVKGRRVTVPLVREMFAQDAVPDLPSTP
jgi:DnaA-homolog protein